MDPPAWATTDCCRRQFPSRRTRQGSGTSGSDVVGPTSTALRTAGRRTARDVRPTSGGAVVGCRRCLHRQVRHEGSRERRRRRPTHLPSGRPGGVTRTRSHASHDRYVLVARRPGALRAATAAALGAHARLPGPLLDQVQALLDHVDRAPRDARTEHRAEEQRQTLGLAAVLPLSVGDWRYAGRGYSAEAALIAASLREGSGGHGAYAEAELLTVRGGPGRAGGVSRRTFYRWRELRIAPRCIRLPNGELRVRRDALEDWLKDRAEGAA